MGISSTDLALQTLELTMQVDCFLSNHPPQLKHMAVLAFIYLVFLKKHLLRVTVSTLKNSSASYRDSIPKKPNILEIS